MLLFLTNNMGAVISPANQNIYKHCYIATNNKEIEIIMKCLTLLLYMLQFVSSPATSKH